MDKHQQVFWTDINLRHKNKCPKKKTKKKQSTQTELFAYVKTAKYRLKIVPILYGEQQKIGKKEFEIGISFISFTNDHSCR